MFKADPVLVKLIISNCEPTAHRFVRKVILPKPHRFLEGQCEPSLVFADLGFRKGHDTAQSEAMRCRFASNQGFLETLFKTFDQREARIVCRVPLWHLLVHWVHTLLIARTGKTGCSLSHFPRYSALNAA